MFVLIAHLNLSTNLRNLQIGMGEVWVLILGYNRTSKTPMFAKLLNSKLSKTFPEETKHCISFIHWHFTAKKTGRYASMAPPPTSTKSHVRCYSTLTRSLKRGFTPLNKAHLVVFGKDESKVRFLSRPKYLLTVMCLLCQTIYHLSM